MKDEWKFVNLGSGKQFVTTTGVRTKRELCAGNWDIVIKVYKISYNQLKMLSCRACHSVCVAMET